eukprot:Opistho-2@18722
MNAQEVYQEVLRDVIEKIKPILADEGVPEDVADQILAIWTAKIDESKVTLGNLFAEDDQVYGQDVDQFPAPYPHGQGGGYYGVPGVFDSIPQQDGASDVPANQLAPANDAHCTRRKKRTLPDIEFVIDSAAIRHAVVGGRPTDPAAAPVVCDHVPSVPGQFDGPIDNDDEELGSAEDDEDESDIDNFESLSDVNHVLCQFEKVNRNKTKWKVSLKDGVMHLNNADRVFHKATGEFEF